MRERQRKLLLDLRSKLVAELNTLPYTIYQDATIELLLDVQPKTLEQLEKVKGFPPKGKRITGFGEAVVAIFNRPDTINSFNVQNKSIKIQTKEVTSFDVFK